MIVLHEDDKQILRWNGVSVHLENKSSGVVGVMEVDDDAVIMGSQSPMQIGGIMGNPVVYCIPRDLAGNEEEDDEEET